MIRNNQAECGRVCFKNNIEDENLLSFNEYAEKFFVENFMQNT